MTIMLEIAPVEPNEHAETALMFLEASDREFESGEELQASEKLWGAAAHAIMAVIGERDGEIPSSHRAIREGAKSLATELGNHRIESAYWIANDFHRNFYHRLIDDDEERDEKRQRVRELVEILLPRTPPSLLVDDLPPGMGATDG